MNDPALQKGGNKKRRGVDMSNEGIRTVYGYATANKIPKQRIANILSALDKQTNGSFELSDDMIAMAEDMAKGQLTYQMPEKEVKAWETRLDSYAEHEAKQQRIQEQRVKKEQQDREFAELAKMKEEFRSANQRRKKA